MSIAKPRKDAQYVADILRAAGRIATYMAGMKKSEFLDNNVVSDAVLKNLAFLGEACANISDGTRKLVPEIDWKGFCGLRNLVVHRYWEEDLKIVWDITKKELPEVVRRLRSLQIK